MVKCCVCEQLFEPPPDHLRAWGESGRDFDPTDWECEPCTVAMWTAMEAEYNPDLDCFPECSGDCDNCIPF